MQQLAEVTGLTIAYDPTTGYLFTTWQGRHSGREKRTCCEAILQELERTGSTKILSDASQDLDGWHEITQWLGHDYYEHLLALGVRALALVLPHNLRARTDLTYALAATPHPAPGSPEGLAMDTFADIEAAYSWLRNVR